MQRNGRYKQAHLLSQTPKTETSIEVKSDTSDWRQFSGFELLLMASGALQILVGVLSVGLSVLGMITPLWVATLMSMFGSVITMIGAYIIYEVYKSRKSVENLSKDAINRVIKEQN